MQGNLITRIVLTCLVVGVPVGATEIAGLTYTATQLNPTTYQYNLALDDLGTTNVGTLWFSWIPGEDFMSVSPTNITSPAGWTEIVTHGGGSDGYAIQWIAGSGFALTSGESLAGFDFDSLMTPAQMAGSSPFFNNPPVTTSFVYSGAPFSDAGFELTGQAAQTPEPSSLIMLGLGGVAMAAILRKRNRKTA